jgi:uncharacterized membrane protein AbrB (regulator of aidB expression)
MDYFDGRRMKVKTSDPPSYVEAGFGSWTEMVLDNAKGEVKARIAKKNGGSDVNLKLDFALEYYPALLLTIAGVAATYILYDFMRVPSTWALFVMLVEVLMVWGIVAYSISLTRKKILEDLNMFIQSLKQK